MLTTPLGEPRFHDQFAETQRRKRRLLRRLQYDGATGGQRRTQLPRCHQQREVPGNDLPRNSDRLSQRVGQILRSWCVGHGDRNRIAFDLRRPARHIAKQIDGQRHIGGPRDGERLAVVEALQISEFFGVRFQQIGELPDEASAFGCGHPPPGTVVEGFARGLHGLFNIFTIAFRHLRQNFTGGGIVGGKSLAGNGVYPIAVDQHFARLFDKLRDLRMNLR